MRVFIFGGGNSLNGFDFSNSYIIHKETTIGINYAFKFFKPTILIWADPDIYLQNKEEIDRLNCLKFTKQENITSDYKGIVGYKVSDRFYGVDGLKKGLYSQYLTGLQAISLAVALRYDPIYLMGYDCGEIGGKTHFHDHSKGKKDIFEDSTKYFDVFKDYPIYNCSLKSKLTQFPRVSIEGVLSEIHHI